ncbi:ATP-binding cassette domain-containing protein [Shivajiella indica]|uniref:ATP-binding cassette domain-containing protein n=1 Tax=Shivajiella indica TaxID=872115 RepID=A0ABW5BBF5_9BACT
MAKVLSIRNATVRFLEKIVFEDMDFEWEEGQHWAIIGSSGVELTAFLDTILGRTMVTKGEILRFFAEKYQQEKKESKEVHSFRDLIAIVSQQYAFRNKSNLQNFYYQQRFNSMDSEETLTVAEYLLGLDHQKGEWNIKKVLNLFKLESLKDKSLIKLSNGETRRLAMASALVKNPKLMLLDQPLTGLDIQTRNSFDRILQEIRESGIHVMISTNSHEIPASISHVAVLGDKKVKETMERKSLDLSEFFPIQLKGFDGLLLKRLLSKNEEEGFKRIIHLENIKVQYGEKVILKDINWTVNPGEKWLLKGENGAGKSTLLSLVLGENPQAYANNIWLFDKKRGSGESIWDIKKQIGFVAPELSRFFPANQTCLKVVLSGLFDTMGLFRKVNKEQEDMAMKWLKLFKVETLAGKLLRQVSLEEQRFILLARALIKVPSLLVLDEASQGMDEYQRVLFKNTIDQICGLIPITLIYVSHYQEDVPDCVDRVFQL